MDSTLVVYLIFLSGFIVDSYYLLPNTQRQRKNRFCYPSFRGKSSVSFRESDKISDVPINFCNETAVASQDVDEEKNDLSPVVHQNVAVGIIETLTNEVNKQIDFKIDDIGLHDIIGEVVHNSPIFLGTPILQRCIHAVVFDFSLHLYNRLAQNVVANSNSNSNTLLKQEREGEEFVEGVLDGRDGDDHQEADLMTSSTATTPTTTTTPTTATSTATPTSNKPASRVVVEMIISDSSVQVVNTFEIAKPLVDVETPDDVSSFSDSVVPSTEALQLIKKIQLSEDSSGFPLIPCIPPIKGSLGLPSHVPMDLVGAGLDGTGGIGGTDGTSGVGGTDGTSGIGGIGYMKGTVCVEGVKGIGREGIVGTEGVNKGDKGAMKYTIKYDKLGVYRVHDVVSPLKRPIRTTPSLPPALKISLTPTLLQSVLMTNQAPPHTSAPAHIPAPAPAPEPSSIPFPAPFPAYLELFASSIRSTDTGTTSMVNTSDIWNSTASVFAQFIKVTALSVTVHIVSREVVGYIVHMAEEMSRL